MFKSFQIAVWAAVYSVTFPFHTQAGELALPNHAASEHRNVIATHRSTDLKLTDTDLKAALNGIGPERLVELRDSPRAQETMVSDLLLRRVIADRARRDGLGNDPDIDARLNIAQERLLSDIYLDYTENQAIDEKKLELRTRDEYRAFPQRYRKEELHARHILVRLLPSTKKHARQTVDELMAKLKAGEDFEELAKTYSDDPASAQKGGDLGWITRGKTVKPFEDALFALNKPGSLSEIVESEFGFHIIQLIERKPPILTPFEHVKPAILANLRVEQRKRLREDLLNSLKEPGAITLDKEALAGIIEALQPTK